MSFCYILLSFDAVYYKSTLCYWLTLLVRYRRYTVNILYSFIYEGIGDILQWSVRSISLTDPSNQDREISVTINNISVGVWSSVLTIRALPINDGTCIGCIVLGQNFDFVYKGVILSMVSCSIVHCQFIY